MSENHLIVDQTKTGRRPRRYQQIERRGDDGVWEFAIVTSVGVELFYAMTLEGPKVYIMRHEGIHWRHQGAGGST